MPEIEEEEDFHFEERQEPSQGKEALGLHEQARLLLERWREVKPPAVDPPSHEHVVCLRELVASEGFDRAAAAMANYRADCEALGRQPQYRIGLFRWVRDGHFAAYLPDTYKPPASGATSTARLLAAEMETAL